MACPPRPHYPDAVTSAPRFAPPPGFARLRLLLAWDGTDFAGWQAQLNAPSVQEALHGAFVRLSD